MAGEAVTVHLVSHTNRLGVRIQNLAVALLQHQQIDPFAQGTVALQEYRAHLLT